MDAQTGPTGDDATRALIEKLKTVRQSCEGRSEDELREILRQALRTELRGLSEVEAGRLLDGVREHLVNEARQRERRLETLEADLRRLASESAALRAERDRLAEENARLDAAPRGAAGGPPSGDSLARIREGLSRIAHGQEATAESIGLPRSEERLFRLIRELLRFALNYETGVHELLQEIEVGAGMGTLLRKQQKKIIEQRFVSCLEDEQGSVQALKEALDRNSSFLLRLHEAYSSAVKQGTRSLLNEFDPQPILDDCKGALGIMNFEKAWRSFSSRQSDLSSLPPDDIWEQFFQETFKKKLADYLEPGPARI
jgi:plasmid stability protein